jgi:hypothetical protein
MLTAAVWYRGRALPIAWAIWPANQPLEGDCFWQRVEALLSLVAELLPQNIPVIWLADRAFGCPAFIDLISNFNWNYVVRVQYQTKYKDRRGVEGQINQLVQRPGQRQKLRAQVFKKQGWREASIVAYWGIRHSSSVLLVSDLPPKWELIYLYRQRYPIEATFRHYKSYGWNWEKGQVTDLEHLQRLLTGMALATWMALLVGTQVAAEILARKASGRRRTIPWVGKRSLFSLGLQRLKQWLHGHFMLQWGCKLSGWDSPKWQSEIYFHHARAFVFARQ